MRKIRLVAFDLDGTLLRGETIDELLARHIGQLDRYLEILQAQTRQEVIANREERATWYSSVPIEEIHSWLATAELAPGVQEAFILLAHHGVNTAIVSITWEFAVSWFAQRFGVAHHVGTRLESDGQLIHFWSEDKAPWLAQLADQLNIDLAETAAVGDTEGDVEMLRLAGTGFFVGDELPSEASGLIHLPRADISVIAQRITTL